MRALSGTLKPLFSPRSPQVGAARCGYLLNTPRFGWCSRWLVSCRCPFSTTGQRPVRVSVLRNSAVWGCFLLPSVSLHSSLQSHALFRDYTSAPSKDRQVHFSGGKAVCCPRVRVLLVLLLRRSFKKFREGITTQICASLLCRHASLHKTNATSLIRLALMFKLPIRKAFPVLFFIVFELKEKPQFSTLVDSAMLTCSLKSAGHGGNACFYLFMIQTACRDP